MQFRIMTTMKFNLLFVILLATSFFSSRELPLAYAAFPGANGKIAFSSGLGALPGRIYAMNPDGSARIQLSSFEGGGEYDYAPAYSPDGLKITFVRTSGSYRDIYVMNADGSGQTRLTSGSTCEDPSWSPDGSKIAFCKVLPGIGGEIYVMNADGSLQTRLTFSNMPHFAPCWSPDGTKIVFYREHDGSDEIYVMNADGSRETRLTFNEVDDRHPTWSPDGSKIAFDSRRKVDSVYLTQIYVMNADGSQQTRLTSEYSDYMPNWQPIRQKAPSLTLFPAQTDGLKVSISGDATAGTSGAKITRIRWDWGDGRVEEGGFSATHMYPAEGTYAITVTVFQSDGLSTSRSVTVTLTVPLSYGFMQSAPYLILVAVALVVALVVWKKRGRPLPPPPPPE